jgi:hypothetical protein
MGGLASGEWSGLEFGGVVLARGCAVGVSGGPGRLVPVVVNGLRRMAPLMLTVGALGGIETSAIVFVPVAFFAVEAGFLSLQPGGFATSQLAALHAVGDALLLVLLMLLDGRLVCSRFRISGAPALLRDNGHGHCRQARGEQHVLKQNLHKTMLGQVTGAGNAYP